MLYHHEARGTDKAITSAMLTSIPSAGEKETAMTAWATRAQAR